MQTCFVIQPFDSGKFDKRFDGVYKPAIESAGLTAYRVDRDPGVEIPIESIESGIRNAAVCLADITTDNPNVWYELGYAFAAGKQVVMVCSNERTSGKYPFDIQHRTVIPYTSEAPRDFEILQATLCEKIKALLTKTEAIRHFAESDQIAPTKGLSQAEILVLALLAGDTGLPNSHVPLYALKNDAERSGLTSIGFSLAFRGLNAKMYIKVSKEANSYQDEPYEAGRLTDAGWEWVEKNEALFTLKKPTMQDIDNSIPF